MPQANSIDTVLVLLTCLMVIFISLLVLVGLVCFFNDFLQELKYLNSEIGRTSGSERRYWIRKRTKLWLSLIPFVRY